MVSAFTRFAALFDIIFVLCCCASLSSLFSSPHLLLGFLIYISIGPPSLCSLLSCPVLCSSSPAPFAVSPAPCLSSLCPTDPLLRSVSGSAPQFRTLCEIYRPSLERDPTYAKLLARTGLVLFNIQPPQRQQGMLGRWAEGEGDDGSL